MIHGEVVGEIWATVKVSSLDGRKLLVVRPAGATTSSVLADVVAVDLVSAGVGDRVIVALGKAARNAIGREDAACEAAIIAVVDDTTVEFEGAEVEPAPQKRRKKAAKKSKRKKKGEETPALPGFEDADAIWDDEDEN